MYLQQCHIFHLHTGIWCMLIFFLCVLYTNIYQHWSNTRISAANAPERFKCGHHKSQYLPSWPQLGMAGDIGGRWSCHKAVLVWQQRWTRTHSMICCTLESLCWFGLAIHHGFTSWIRMVAGCFWSMVDHGHLCRSSQVVAAAPIAAKWQGSAISTRSTCDGFNQWHHRADQSASLTDYIMVNKSIGLLLMVDRVTNGQLLMVN